VIAVAGHHGVVVAVALAVVVLMGVTPTTAGAAALNDTSPAERLFMEDEDGLLPDVDLSAAIAAVDGVQDRVTLQYAPDWILDRLDVQRGDSNATAAAENATAVYNAHNASFETWVNNRTNASTSQDVVEISWHVEGEAATRYLAATVENGTYTDSAMVASTNRSTDETVSLCGLAARRSATELEQFHDRFAGPGENTTSDYLAKLGGRYGADVSSSILSSGSGTCNGDDTT